jgi:hypothetical protein
MGNITNKQLYFLISFGHCGIDWIHSLFDSHPQILITPAFNFYKSWKVLNAHKITSTFEMHSLWMNYFLNNPDMFSKETRLFANEEQYDIFSKSLKDNLDNYGLLRINVFNAIHDSYSQTINPDWQPKIIIAEEHINLPLETILLDFPDSKIIFIVRDPRAAINGYMKLFSKKYADLPDYFDHYFNLAYEQWFLAWDVYSKIKNEKDKYIIIQNETMSLNTKDEMKSVARKLGIEFDDILTKMTFSNGSEWTLDSAYADRKGNLPENQTVKSFLDPIAIKNRWSNDLPANDLIMIENFFHQFIEEFKYPNYTKISSINKIKSYLNYIKPRRSYNRINMMPPNHDEFERTKKRLTAQRPFALILFKLLSPLFMRLFIYIDSVITRFSILFFPSNRWNRYDNSKCYDV